MASRPWIIADRFFDEGAALREHFVENFRDPRSTHPRRFVWDYWYLKDQYAHMRTPAWEYFPKALYRRFHEHLVRWGRENLGCHDVSPPWLSYYVDGCRQELHTDRPHGPWAFVYSLTPWRGRGFRGGETMLLEPGLLAYWDHLDRYPSIERGEAFRLIEPQFNRLTVFDPRLPHGVNEIRGTQDPLDARVVIHGWFVGPRPYIDGPHRADRVQAAVDRLGEFLAADPLFAKPWDGYTCLRVRLLRDGRAGIAQLVQNTLRGPGGVQPSGAALTAALRRGLRVINFGPARGTSSLTLPLQFSAR